MAGAGPVTGRWRRSAPWSSPVEGDWRQARFSVIDVETTGLDLRRDEIVSIGVVDVVRARIDVNRWYRVVRPGRPIETEAMKIHALTEHELASAPSIDVVVKEFRARVRGSILVAHAAWVERAFLDRALRPLSERLPHGLVDTAALTRAVGLRGEAGHEPHLETLARELGVPVHTPHHSLGDAMTTATVLLVLASRLESERGHLDVKDLLELSR